MALSPNMNVMIKAAEKAGRSLIRDFGEVEQLQISAKGPGDFVSAADHRSEEIIFETLSHARPDHQFLMEERGQYGNTEAEYRWIVDPLDGTSNFLHGIPHWNISIALEKAGEIIAGIVYDPVKDELFRAEKGTGAFVRNKRLRVSGRQKMTDAVFLAGSPRAGQKKHQQFINEYQAMLGVCPGVRRMGAAALDMAYVAAGRSDGFWERELQAWDIAAGYIIVKEAGGIVQDITKRGANPIKTGDVICGSPTLFETMRKILAKANAEKDAA